MVSLHQGSKASLDTHCYPEVLQRILTKNFLQPLDCLEFSFLSHLNKNWVTACDIIGPTYLAHKFLCIFLDLGTGETYIFAIAIEILQPQAEF